MTVILALVRSFYFYKLYYFFDVLLSNIDYNDCRQAISEQHLLLTAGDDLNIGLIEPTTDFGCSFRLNCYNSGETKLSEADELELSASLASGIVGKNVYIIQSTPSNHDSDDEDLVDKELLINRQVYLLHCIAEIFCFASSMATSQIICTCNNLRLTADGAWPELFTKTIFGKAWVFDETKAFFVIDFTGVVKEYDANFDKNLALAGCNGDGDSADPSGGRQGRDEVNNSPILDDNCDNNDPRGGHDEDNNSPLAADNGDDNDPPSNSDDLDDRLYSYHLSPQALPSF